MQKQNVLLSLLALFSSFFASVLNVGLSWFFIFRHKSFDEQMTNLDKKKAELKELKLIIEEDIENEKKYQKKLKRLESDVNTMSTALSTKTIKYNLFLNVLIFIINKLIKSAFDGIVVSRIPFQPWNLITKITHAGLETDDLCDGNFQFVYWLGTLFFKDAMNRYFGFIMPQMTLPNKYKLE